MNTSFLSAFPTATPVRELSEPRPARNETSAAKGVASGDDVQPETFEPAADSEKADAFAEMLAAMMSPPAAMAEAVVATESKSESVSVTSVTADVPRDGAGSPLFTSTLTSSTAAATTGLADAVPLTESAGGNTAMAGLAEAGSNLTDAAAAELAELGMSSGEQLDGELGAVLQSESVDQSSLVNAADVPEPATVASAVVEIRTSVEPVDQKTGASAANAVADADAMTADREPVVTTPPAAHPEPVASDRIEPAIFEATMEPVAEVPVTNEPDIDSASSGVAEPTAIGIEPATTVSQFSANAEPNEEPTSKGLERPARTESEPARPSATTSSQLETKTSADPIAAEVGPPDVVAVLSGVAAETDVLRSPVRERPAPETNLAVENMPTEAVGGATATSIGGVDAVSAPAAAAGAVYSDSAVAAKPAQVTQQVLQALAAYEAELPSSGSRSFELLLDPPELGRLLVQMSRTAKGVDVRISAENETVRSILETTGQELQQSLQLSGFDLGQFGGSSSNDAFGGGHEFVFAPSRQSFTAGGEQPARTVTPVPTDPRAVNVVV